MTQDEVRAARITGIDGVFTGLFGGLFFRDSANDYGQATRSRFQKQVSFNYWYRLKSWALGDEAVKDARRIQKTKRAPKFMEVSPHFLHFLLLLHL